MLNHNDDVHVLYIAGMGRSGSTLLCRTLGCLDGFVATGELMRIIDRGVGNGDLCSCGAPVTHCALWSRVLADMERRCLTLDLTRAERTRKRITESWEFLRYLFLPGRVSGLERDLDHYRHFLLALYRSIRAVSGATIVVDASKNVFFAKLLTQTPGVKVSFVHLVRDSRGVAHSWARKQQRPGTHGRLEYFRQLGPFRGPILWSGANMMTEWLRPRVWRFVRVKYEDFVSAPSATVNRIVRELEAPPDASALAHVNGSSVHLGIDHLIASNPNRSRRGEVTLHEDVTWRHEMSTLRQWLVTGLTFPLLRKYGYPVLPEPMEDAQAVRGTVTHQPEQ